MKSNLGEVSDDEVECVLLHVGSLAPVGGLQDLQHVLHGHIPLQVGLTEYLQPAQHDTNEDYCRIRSFTTVTESDSHKKY